MLILVSRVESANLLCIPNYEDIPKIDDKYLLFPHINIS